MVWGLLSINLAYGWGPQGHRVVGAVAESNLAPETKKYIAEEFNINNLADIANWADKVKLYRKQEKPWHYTNVKEDEWVYVMSRDCPKRSCVIEKIKEFSVVLENVKLPLKRRKIALRYLVHFVGDADQPLHLGNSKDRGGGKIRLTYLGKKVTLHSSETNIFIYPLFFLHNFLLHFFLKLLGLRAKIPSKRDDMTFSPQFLHHICGMAG